MTKSSVPFVPTPPNLVKKMLEVACVSPNDVVFDLGCGDGRIVISAAKDFGAYAVGVEIRKDLIEKCLDNVRKEQVEERVMVVEDDFFNVDISQATVVAIYLLTSVNEKLRPKFHKELRKGTRIVSHDFEIRGWTPEDVIEVKDGWRSHKIYFYVL